MWEQHVKGTGPGLGIVPVRPDGTVSFGALDVDKLTKRRNPGQEALRPSSPPAKGCLRPVTLSKSGGAHLWVFLREPRTRPRTPSQCYARAEAGASASGLKDKKVEIFPKQAHVQELWTWARGSTCPTTAAGHIDGRCGVNSAGERLALEDFVRLANARLMIDSAELRTILAAKPDRMTSRRRPDEASPTRRRACATCSPRGSRRAAGTTP